MVSKDALVELTTQAKRKGGLHAAAGTLGAGAGESIRLELLSLIFRSKGLPSQYSRASFLLWLREEGLEEAVKSRVASAGGDFEKELTNLYVSDAIAKAILAERPDFAGKPAEVKLLLQKQFPKVSDISTDDLIEKIKLTLGGKKGKVPCLLIVLDEVQQYIGDSLDRSKAVQDLQEQCCARLGANVLFVATGQNALSGTPLLLRLQGRFPVTIELQDTDVEQVTREVVLKKKPSAEAALLSLLEAHAGEIERHLASSKIAPNARDRGFVVRDYPLLPVRRRFWERVLRAVDKAGTGAQLRTQLWIVHDAVEKTADLPLGNVVDAAFIYDHIQSRVLQSASSPGNLRDDRQAGPRGRRALAVPALRPGLPDRAVAPRRTERRGHPRHARDARRPARHRPEPEQRRVAEEGRPCCSKSWSPTGRSCGSRASTACRPARGASGTWRTRRR